MSDRDSERERERERHRERAKRRESEASTVPHRGHGALAHAASEVYESVCQQLAVLSSTSECGHPESAALPLPNALVRLRSLPLVTSRAR